MSLGIFWEDTTRNVYGRIILKNDIGWGEKCGSMWDDSSSSGYGPAVGFYKHGNEHSSPIGGWEFDWLWVLYLLTKDYISWSTLTVSLIIVNWVLI